MHCQVQLLIKGPNKLAVIRHDCEISSTDKCIQIIRGKHDVNVNKQNRRPFSKPICTRCLSNFPCLFSYGKIHWFVTTVFAVGPWHDMISTIAIILKYPARKTWISWYFNNMHRVAINPLTYIGTGSAIEILTPVTGIPV